MPSLPPSPGQPLPGPAPAGSASRPAVPPRDGGKERIGPYAILGGCLFTALASLLLPATVLYDPMTWLVWGRDIGGLELDTRGLGPAWKPLPALVDVALAPLGAAAPAAWLLLARTGALVSLAMAYRLAARVAGPGAGVVAVVFLAATTEFLGELVPGGMSEPLLLALVLLALDRALAGRSGPALAALVAAALLRPEVWPFLGGYGLLLWVREPRWRLRLAALAALVLLLWFGGEWWGSGDPLRSSSRAGLPTEGGPLLTANPGLATLVSMAQYLPTLAWPGVALAVLLAALAARQPPPPADPHRRLVLALFALAAAWVAVVAGMTAAGLSAGDQRYLLVSAGCAAVLSGIGWTRAVGLLRASARQLAHGGAGARLAGAGALGVSAVVLALGVADLSVRAGHLPDQLGRRVDEAEDFAALAEVVRQAGGPAALLRCGRVSTGPYQVPYVAWRLGVSMPEVDYRPHVPGVALLAVSDRDRPPVPPGFRPVELRGDAAQRWQLLTSCPAPPASPGS